MFPFSIANVMKAAGNGEFERQYAFGRQKLFIFMARFRSSHVLSDFT